MSELLGDPPFSSRDDVTLLREMNALSRWHITRCTAYRAVWPGFSMAATLEELPYLHVGAFKHREWRTMGDGIAHQRVLTSSATSGESSRIVLDTRSGPLQARSSTAILQDLLGAAVRPLLVLDHAKSLQRRGEVSARVTAAMGLRPLASEIHFVLQDDASSMEVDWDRVGALCADQPRLLVYGFTSILWTAWAQGAIPHAVRRLLSSTEVHFVHSGGWKKLESLNIDRSRFDATLLETCGPRSTVLDFYGLVEQVGIVYPLCSAGWRHVPRWSAVVVRDPWTLAPMIDAPGILQLMNPFAWGAPYHSVLTEDMGRCPPPGPCECGRIGQRFELLGRMPLAEVRGCANV